MVEATGSSLGEAFAQLALGMYNMMSPLDGIEEVEEFTVEATGRDLEGLLFNLMDEFLFITDVEFLIPHKITLEVDAEAFTAKGTCVGERFSAETHEVGIQIKAVTYHMMVIKETPDGWYVRMVFDT